MSDQPDPPVARSSRPIFIKVKDKKKKRKYSRGLGDLQRAGRRLTRVSLSVSEAMFRGGKTFRKASNKSSLKKRDGALRDLGLNLGKAMSKTIKVSSSVPADMARAVYVRSTRRSIRRQIRAAARFNRIFRLR